MMALKIMGELDYGALISHQINPLILSVEVYFLMNPFNIGNRGRSNRKRNRPYLTSADIHVIFMGIILLLFFSGLIHYLLMIVSETLMALPSEILTHEGHLENLTLVIID